MFIVPDKTQLARISLNNPMTGHQETWDVLIDDASVAHAIRSFAMQQKIHPADVQYSTRYPMVS